MKRLTLAQQKKLYYALSPFNEPTLSIEPGETVVIETEDAFSGQVRKEGDRRDLVAMPFGNPQSGPIYVKGAEKGDTLTVEIKEIKPLIGQGATRIPSYWWFLGDAGSVSLNKFLKPQLPHGTKIIPIKDGKVYFDKLVLPYEPMIGTLGTAPEIEAITSDLPGNHGGNMDVPDFCVGNKAYFPVNVPGALFHVGDAHAVQGDAEICGTAVEMPAKITLTIDLVKGKKIRWPRIESPEDLISVACSGAGRPLEEAIRIAFVELVLWLEELGLNRWDAYQLCTQTARVRLGNLWAVAAKFPKKYLNATERS